MGNIYEDAKGTPNLPVVFFVDSILSKDSRGFVRKGFAFKPIRKPFAVVSASERDPGTLSHEVGHILWLGHQHLSKDHLLMKDGAEYLNVFSQDSKRFTWKEEEAIFENAHGLLKILTK